MNIILFGPQGSGKGTQAKFISQKYSIPHISTGDIFRENIKNKTELGQKIEEIINSGALVPDEVTNEIVKDRLSKIDCQNGFILDGFPRSLTQASFLNSFVEIDLALEIWISDEEAVKRIGLRRVCPNCGAVYHLTHIIPKKEGICDVCGTTLIKRDDDKEEAIKKRLAIYHSETEELTSYYKDKEAYKKIDGMGSVEEVNEQVSKIILG